MDLPPGCGVPQKYSRKACRLKKSLYGLKQSPRAWFGRFAKFTREFGYKQSNLDHILFLKQNQGKLVAPIVYVDDMVVTRNDPKERKTLQDYLLREFEMKNLDSLKYFLGIKVSDLNQEFSCYKENTGYICCMKLACLLVNQLLHQWKKNSNLRLIQPKYRLIKVDIKDLLRE